MVIKAFILLFAYSGWKGTYHKRVQCSVPKMYLFVLYREKGMTLFLTWDFSEFYASWKKTNYILAIMGNSNQKTSTFYENILIWKFYLIWHDLGLPSLKNQVGLCHSVKWLLLSIVTCEMIQTTCVAQNVFWLLFHNDFCDMTLILTFLSMGFILTKYPSGTFTSTLGDFELFEAV